METLTPISNATSLMINHDYGYREVLGGNKKGAEAMKAVLQNQDTILTAWEHKNIGPLALELGASKEVVPTSWPSDDFDSVYELSFSDDGQTVTNFQHRQEDITPMILSAFGINDKVETMTVCANCTATDGCDESSPESKSFKIKPNKCTSPTIAFPDDLDLWGDFDFLDVCDEHRLVRTFFSSKDGSCLGQTDVYKLEYNTCLGPFGPETPWGVFSCE